MHDRRAGAWRLMIHGCIEVPSQNERISGRSQLDLSLNGIQHLFTLSLGVLCPRTASSGRRNEGRVSSLQSLGGTEGATGAYPPSRIRSARRLRSSSAHRGQSSQRASVSITRSQHGPGLRIRQEQLRTRLKNPPGNNACYFNTTVLALIHLS